MEGCRRIGLQSSADCPQARNTLEPFDRGSSGAENHATAVRPSGDREEEDQTLDIEAGPLREVEQARRVPQYRGTKLGSAWPSHIARRVGGHMTNRINHAARKAVDHTSYTS